MRYLSADVGGTFTDLVLYDSTTRTVRVDKVPSARRGSADSVIIGIRRMLQQAGLEPGALDLFVHGFTVATNAFLMRTGSRAVLVTTGGFRDLLEIGDQRRPLLYSLVQSRPTPVIPRSRVVEVRERVDAFGEVVEGPEAREIARVVDAVAALDPESIAICLNFAPLNDCHERIVAKALRQRMPEVPVYLSSEVNPQIEEYARGNTTAMAAYVGPIVDRYVAQIERDLVAHQVGAPLRLMRSDGGIATPRAARTNPAHMLLSGPAGGVIAGAWLSRELGVPDVVTFDMGGTSADFSAIIDGVPRRVSQRIIDGQPLRLPSLDIETISAGGGSVGWIDRGGALRVGPHSAGSIPGPACYATGGEDATITDACVVLGLLDPDGYLGGGMKLDPVRAEMVVREQIAEPLGLSVEGAALGLVTVANARMTQAIRTLSVERGLDVRRFALLAFGGAGPLLAPYLADALSMAEILVPAHPGVFAAEGLLLSDIRHNTQAPWRQTLEGLDADELARRFQGLATELEHELEADHVEAAARSFHYGGDLRYVGQFHEIEIPLPAPGEGHWWDSRKIHRRFVETHRRLYGHAADDAPVEIVNLRVEARGAIPRPAMQSTPTTAGAPPVPLGTRRVYADRSRGWETFTLFHRDALRPGHRIDGPAIVTQLDTTVLIPAHTHAQVDRGAVLRIRRNTR